ncbi:hypothetical protein D9M69_705180 [compost metagenome]
MELAKHGLDGRAFLQERAHETFGLGELQCPLKGPQGHLRLVFAVQRFGQQNAQFQRPAPALQALGFG